MIVVILCAGKGSRAREVTGNVPKSLYPVPFYPALGYILDFVKPLGAPIRIVVNPQDLFSFIEYVEEWHSDMPIAFV